jgi:cbb3-type cytochrome oxidase maturation protein
MYFPFWIILVIFSLTVSLAAFLWGLKSGQFADQDRARFLPLGDISPQALVKEKSKWTMEVYALLFIGLLVLSSLAASLFLSWLR